MKVLDIELRYSLRMFVAYESLTGEPFTGGTVSSAINLLVAAIATSKDVMDGSKTMPTLDAIYDAIDADEKLLTDFSAWIAASGKPSELIIGDAEDGEKKS